ncbi:MarR family transcriptional regulator [Lysinibacillus agricola]|uniref:MarR family transcriptional regulator n=1 Tax=Lysinibacillus agricola TaxID=2590012 RepID=A0ABX7AVR0_9BACI|nr:MULTISPECIES: MarR family transcriptional regulator [Lysinibacillus]KOS59739.1 MarR family transcriptional regulator [Lysinibacillus sp. FJAT-14222]QQP12963.1 MarR family transcriptional regulator [Lysinibacillus agricola]
MENIKNALINLQCELVAERNKVNLQNISWIQYDILHLLSEEERLLPSQISTILGISRTKLSKSLKDLKRLGYLEQKPNVQDGRELITMLTVDGKAILTNIEVGHEELYKIASSVFSEEELALFSELSMKFSKALKDERLKEHE